MGIQKSHLEIKGPVSHFPEGPAHGFVDQVMLVMQQRFGECIVAAHLPPVGSATQPVEGGYMANAWMRVRHPDYDSLREIMNTIGETVKIHAA